MSQLFSFSRFRRLFRRHTAEYLPSYAMATAVLAGGIGLVLGFVVYLNVLAPTIQGMLFMLGLLASGALFTAGIFAQYGAPKQATVALTLPASQLEKYLVGWVYSFLIFSVVYTACYYLVDWLMVGLDDWYGRPKELFSLFSSDHKVYEVFFYYAALHAGALWGAIFFEKNHFIKTAFGALILAIVLVAANYQVVKAFAGDKLQMASPFSSITLNDATGFYRVSLPDAQAQWYILLPLALAALLWRATYLRLTEKQL
ncbi:hypothetical protein [Hymenobacter sp. PAMC 26628]|uniref:hypothetical protein n=1 Tax=Hymenobacter sp. PAMC 26628 TaxID=1484118 RepID=UPI00077008F4|nr:hypothetical protein [Hymenobacter sp. PAMC 26628]AMJ66834.1 hypothetical protein AXW84_16415 [Hymenobacter sp. PAMC 26628]